MDKNIVIRCAASLVLSVLVAMPPVAKAGESGTTIFSDDFESYALGTFPSAGGWELIWNGKGTEHQFVSDAYSFAGEKSLQLWGRPNWSSVAQRKFSTDAPVIGYECGIRMDSIGTGGPGREESVCFFNREAYVWGRGYAAVLFNHDDGKIKAEDGTVLGDWEPGVWYQVKDILDRRANTYDVWIDGQLRAEGLSTTHSDTELIDAVALMSDHAGVKVYYDDVRVFEVHARPQLLANRDVGSPALAGAVSYDAVSEAWTVVGGGNDIGGTSDEFHYVFRPLTGDGEATVRVVSMDATDEWAKAGVMIRETLDDNSEHAMIAMTGTHGVQTVWRQETGGSSADVTTGGVITPCWIRIERVGDAFNTYYSPDSLMWMPQQSLTIPMSATLYIGLGVVSRQSDALATAVFDNVTLTAPEYNLAWAPSPADGSQNTPLDTKLSWMPGDTAVSHDIYFGTDFDAVADANQASAEYRGLQALDANDWDPGGLEPGTTYFWRIDELEADGTTVHTGNVWSFNVQPRTAFVGYWKVHNREDNDLVEWSREFQLPARQKPVGYSVARRDEQAKKWVDETDKWSGSAKELGNKGSGHWRVRIKIKDADPVPKCTRLAFDVQFSCDKSEIGFYRGSDRKYKPDPCPKAALKKAGLKKACCDPSEGIGADIDNAVFYGGEMGQSLPELGLDIPAHTYAYLYQVNAIEGPNPITSFYLYDVNEMFDDFGELGASHDGSAEVDYVSDEIGEPNTGVSEVSVATFDRLGAHGIVPTYWGPEGDDFGAHFKGLSAGQNSTILVAFSRIGPDMPDDKLNALVTDGTVVAHGGLWTPAWTSGLRLAGDINTDGCVDFLDLAIVAKNWLKCTDIEPGWTVLTIPYDGTDHVLVDNLDSLPHKAFVIASAQDNVMPFEVFAIDSNGLEIPYSRYEILPGVTSMIDVEEASKYAFRMPISIDGPVALTANISVKNAYDMEGEISSKCNGEKRLVGTLPGAATYDVTVWGFYEFVEDIKEDSKCDLEVYVSWYDERSGTETTPVFDVVVKPGDSVTRTHTVPKYNRLFVRIKCCVVPNEPCYFSYKFEKK